MEEEQRSAALSFRIKPSLKAALEQLAKADRRPLSNYLELALEAHVETMKVDEKDGPGVRLRGVRAKR
jgi:predicted transcriptional regulator